MSGTQRPVFSHFNRKSSVLSTPICIGFKVTIKSLNICPARVLYNGCLGTAVDIIYDHPQSPKNYATNVPNYIIVDIPDFKSPQVLMYGIKTINGENIPYQKSSNN